MRIHRDISATKVPLKEPGDSNPCQDPQPRAPEPERGAHITSAVILSARERSESARNPGTLLKGQHTKSSLQSLILGSSRGRTEWTRVNSGEIGVCGSEINEGTAPQYLC